MKVRVGFVSNSSSSSFVLFGVKVGTKLTKDLCINIMKAYGYDFEAVLEEKCEFGETFKESDVRDVFSEFEFDVFQVNEDLVIISDTECGAPPNSVYIGRRIDADPYEGSIDGIVTIQEVGQIIDGINKKLGTNYQGEIIIGTRMT